MTKHELAILGEIALSKTIDQTKEDVKEDWIEEKGKIADSVEDLEKIIRAFQEIREDKDRDWRIIREYISSLTQQREALAMVDALKKLKDSFSMRQTNSI